MKNLKTVSAILAIIGTIGSGIFFTVGFFAHAKDLNKTDEEMFSVKKQVVLNTKNIKVQAQSSLRDHLWDEKLFLKKHLRKNPTDEDAQNEYERVIEKLKEVKEELKKLRNSDGD